MADGYKYQLIDNVYDNADIVRIKECINLPVDKISSKLNLSSDFVEGVKIAFEVTGEIPWNSNRPYTRKRCEKMLRICKAHEELRKSPTMQLATLCGAPPSLVHILFYTLMFIEPITEPAENNQTSVKKRTTNLNGHSFAQLCELCQHAVPNLKKGTLARGCSWSRELKPVEGWTATKVSKYKSDGEFAYDTYHIVSCPLFLQDEPKDKK